MRLVLAVRCSEQHEVLYIDILLGKDPAEQHRCRSCTYLLIQSGMWYVFVPVVLNSFEAAQSREFPCHNSSF